MLVLPSPYSVFGFLSPSSLNCSSPLVIHPCCRLLIKRKEFSLAKINIAIKRSRTASKRSVQYCKQYFTHLSTTDCIFSVILLLVRFSSAFTFSSFLWRSSRELWQRSFFLSWPSIYFFCFSRSSLLLSNPAFFKASLICLSHSFAASLVRSFWKRPAASWSIF